MLPKTCRLSRADFLTVKSQGKVTRHSLFTLITLPNQLGHNRFTIITSSKFHKLATVRNKFRRLVYLAVASLPGQLDIILYPAASMLNLTREEISALVNSSISKTSSF